MIAVDTNVLLRYLLSDDPVQSPKAAALFQGREKILITDVVLVETIWTLKGKKYNLDRAAISLVINALFEEPLVCFEENQTVWRAFSDFKKAKSVKVGRKYKQADFADALIVNKAKHNAACSSDSLKAVYTFDVAALALTDTTSP